MRPLALHDPGIAAGDGEVPGAQRRGAGRVRAGVTLRYEDADALTVDRDEGEPLGQALDVPAEYLIRCSFCGHLTTCADGTVCRVCAEKEGL